MRGIANSVLVAAISLSLNVGCEDGGQSPVTTASAGGTTVGQTNGETAPTDDRVDEADGPTDAQSLVEQLDTQIEFHRGRATSQASFTDWDIVAGLHMKRARITGVGNDYEKAGDALEEAFELVKTPPASILVTRARLAQTQHRFADARRDLETSKDRPFTQVGPHQESKVLRGVVAYESGDWEGAQTLWREAQEIQESPGTTVLLANLHLNKGELEQAQALFDKAVEQAKKADDFTAAWTLVQRGLFDLDRGDAAGALPFYEQAGERFSGWYVVEEHLAEALASTGEKERAAKIYDSVVSRVPDPELMAAYAGLLEEMGRTEDSKRWYESAKTELNKAIEDDPAGTSGHGIDLLIEWDPPKAVELARLDYGARPGPRSAVQLSHALVANEEYDAAWDLLKPAVVDGWWRSPRAHALVHIVATERGDEELAKEHADLATELHPTIIAEMTGE